MTSPSDDWAEQEAMIGEQLTRQEQGQLARPYPCPECSSTKGYSRVGKYRSQCKNCNALLRNAEVNLEDQEPQ
jgi:ribosomal protein L37AE/L43A